MLVLSRKRQEVVLISDTISIRILDIIGDRVRLGIEAPKDVSIRRAELLEKLEK